MTDIESPLFKEELHYTDGTGTPRYNGNISSISWKAGEEQTTRGYRFTYDGLNRMKMAEYGEGEQLAYNPNRFNEEVTAYDKTGNILGLRRTGQTGAQEYGLVDNLALTYNGNRLKKVTDNAAGSAYNNGFEFKDGADRETEYTYDENGNLTQDLNRNIEDIQYNFLNLPQRIEFGDGSTTEYLYDAEGRKLRTVHRADGKTTTTDYAGNLIYENGKPIRLVTEYGYVSLPDGMYHYYLQDHQGNNRVVADRNGKVEEVNHYYPFGGMFANNGNVQPYKYNGKELDTRKGLNWYDYGARHYDPAIGRWHSQDPMQEKYYSISPYIYCNNNPILYIDQWGLEFAPGDLFKTKKEAAKDWGTYYNGTSIIRKKEMGSSIYEVRKNGKLQGYSYSEAKIGNAHNAQISNPPNDEKVVGTIHSHGDYNGRIKDKQGKEYMVIDNMFSSKDKQINKKLNVNGYLATPNGTLLEYVPSTDAVNVVSKSLPSDPQDPSRKNNITPKERNMNNENTSIWSNFINWINNILE